MIGPELHEFERLPRRSKYLFSYIGHVVQGFFAAVVLGWLTPIALVACYIAYQALEFSRAIALRRAKANNWAVLDEWPSRDIADFLLGLWGGMVVGMAWQAWLAWCIMQYRGMVVPYV